MIASQKIGKSFMGALGYNLGKMNRQDIRQRAEMLDTNFISLNRDDIRKEVNLLRQLRPNLKRYVYHTSLNFPQEELQSLTNEKLLAIAHDYLDANGFNNNQYMIFRHYDAGHPHLHLLVNRIRFDGTVVSDSNNYKKSEAILRKLEKLYNLVAVEPSNKAPQRAAKKDELEMAIRTGKPSDKMLLQEIMNTILKENNLTLSELISAAEERGLSFIFNQASTGRISGITYFCKEFKIKGQALGNRFKWSELIKHINYEQARDSKAVSEANSRTRERYGAFTNERSNAAGNRPQTANRGNRIYSSDPKNIEYDRRERADIETATTGNKNDRNESLETNKAADLFFPDSADTLRHHPNDITIEISDDEDDAKYRRKSRNSGR